MSLRDVAAVMGLVSVVAVAAMACSSSSSSGGGSGSGCAGLATCCGSLPANEDPSGCATIASAGIATDCDATITALHTASQCTSVTTSAGKSSSGTGTGAGTGTGTGAGTGTGTGTTGNAHSCADLTACCNSSGYPAGVKTDCLGVATAGNASLCASDLASQTIFCPGIGSGS